MEEERQLNSKKPRMSGNGNGSSSYKTQLCRRFRQGACALGSKCTYAHGLADVRRSNRIHEPILCRMFSQNKHCSYGHTCRFLHSISSQTHTQHHQPQAGGKHDGYSSAEFRVMHTSAAATNASTSTVATSSLHKNEQPYSVKCIFKENELQKISRIYADWI